VIVREQRYDIVLHEDLSWAGTGGIVGIAGQTTHVSLLDLSKCIAPGSRYRDSAWAAKTDKKLGNDSRPLCLSKPATGSGTF